ncbi:hemolymph lipopolysaccharide-binding protein isoform X2 [Anabrus simplex]
MIGLALIVSAVFIHTQAADECIPKETLGMKLSIDNRRNQTGHWVSKVQLKHSDEGEVKGDPWTVDVEQKTAGCEDKGFVVVEAVLTSPLINSTSQKRIKMRKVLGVGEYLYYMEPTTWLNARNICAEREMHLAVPNSAKEAATLAAIMNEEPPKDDHYLHNTAHIGFNDLETEGVYVTVTGQKLEESGYAKWCPGNPNLNFHEDCGGIDRDGLLHDVGCSHLLPFFCEKP